MNVNKDNYYRCSCCQSSAGGFWRCTQKKLIEAGGLLTYDSSEITWIKPLN